MICSECGSYQSDRAKYCGVCGSALSQEGLMESFLKKDTEKEIVLPRHRSPWFYLVVTAIVILALALLTGAGYLVYKAAWGEGKDESKGGEVEDNTRHYMNSDIGFSLSYPDTWTLEEGYAKKGELMALKFSLSSQKNLELYALQLDPVITIGGIEGIKEYIYEDADKRIRSLGGAPAGGGQSGYTTEEPSQGNSAGQGTPDEEDNLAEDRFTSTRINSLPAFYSEFNANVMGEETRFLLYYLVADDYLFVLQGRAPVAEYKDTRPLLMAIAGSFKWEQPDETTPEGAPAISAW